MLGLANAAVSEGTGETRRSAVGRRVPILVAVLLVGLALGLLVRGWVGATGAPEDETTRPTRLSITVPVDQVVKDIELAGDGETLVYIAESGATGGDLRPRLYSRRLDAFEIREVPDSEGVDWVEFSPDSRNVAYFTRNRDGAGGVVKRVALGRRPRRGAAAPPGHDRQTRCGLVVRRRTVRLARPGSDACTTLRGRRRARGDPDPR